MECSHETLGSLGVMDATKSKYNLSLFQWPVSGWKSLGSKVAHGSYHDRKAVSIVLYKHP